MSKQKTYTVKDIRKIDPRKHIRRRPGMYFGGTDKHALHVLFDITPDMFAESAMRYNCTTIIVTLQPENWVTVTSDDTEFPSKVANRPYLLDHLTEVGAGYTPPSYRISDDRHGLELSILIRVSEQPTVRAVSLSKWTRALDVATTNSSPQRHREHRD